MAKIDNPEAKVARIQLCGVQGCCPTVEIHLALTKLSSPMTTMAKLHLPRSALTHNERCERIGNQPLFPQQTKGFFLSERRKKHENY